MMTVKVVDRRGNPVFMAHVVVKELRSKREQERNAMRGTTNEKGCVHMNIYYECKAEIAINGRIYGVFLLDTFGEITIRVKD